MLVVEIVGYKFKINEQLAEDSTAEKNPLAKNIL